MAVTPEETRPVDLNEVRKSVGDHVVDRSQRSFVDSHSI